MDSEKLNNLADAIELYILRRMRDAGRSEITVRRSELAGRILCAPSQVSYVLNTRFTVERGFKVESRRGVNGFVRIVRLSERQPLPEQVRADDVAEMPREGLRDLTLAWRRQGIISERERRFINTAIDLIFEKLPPDERPAAVRRLLAELI